jgi:putative metallohydrolase (TIGR04338 family)
MGGAWARRSTGTVCLAPWARRPHVILHELAHLLTPDRHAAHGPEFAKAFIALARRFEPDLAPNLVAEFRAARVRTRVAA